jgi:hypothetical protein
VNKSQENWPDTQLSLSTATPSLGGAPPKLMTLKVNYYQRPNYRADQCYFSSIAEEADMEDDVCYLQSAGLAELSVQPSRKRKGFASFRERSSLNSKSVDGKETTEAENTVNVLSTTAEASMSSTSFAIPRRATIDADVSVHFSFPTCFFSSHEH